MEFWILLAVAVGVLLPVILAGTTMLARAGNGSPASWGLMLAVVKGMTLGIIMGLTVSAAVIAVALGLARMLGR